jgi:hypothetical protein
VDECADICGLLTAVIEVEDTCVALAAIDARVGREVFRDSAADPECCRPAPRADVLDV